MWIKDTCPRGLWAKSTQILHSRGTVKSAKTRVTHRGVVDAGGSSWGRSHADRGGESGCVRRVSAARALAVNNRRPAASAGRPPKAPPLPPPIGRVGAIEYLPLTTQRWISARHFDIAALRRRASHVIRQQTKTPFYCYSSGAASESFSNISKGDAYETGLTPYGASRWRNRPQKKQRRYSNRSQLTATHAQPSRNSFLTHVLVSEKTADGSKGWKVLLISFLCWWVFISLTEKYNEKFFVFVRMRYSSGVFFLYTGAVNENFQITLFSNKNNFGIFVGVKMIRNCIIC